jgi:hypothetical protein
MLTTYQKKDSEILRLEQLLGFCLMKIHAVVVAFRKKKLGSKFFGRGSERRISQRRLAKNFRTSKWSF